MCVCTLLPEYRYFERKVKVAISGKKQHATPVVDLHFQLSSM